MIGNEDFEDEDFQDEDFQDEDFEGIEPNLSAMSFWRPRHKYRVNVTCLKCDNKFLGTSKFNRICENCTYSNESLRAAFI